MARVFLTIATVIFSCVTLVASSELTLLSKFRDNSTEFLGQPVSLRGSRDLATRCPPDWLYYKDSDFSEGHDSCLKEFDASVMPELGVDIVSHSFAGRFCRSLGKRVHLVTFRSNKRYSPGDSNMMTFLFDNLVSIGGHVGCYQLPSAPIAGLGGSVNGNTGYSWVWDDKGDPKNLLCKAPNSDAGCPNTLWGTYGDTGIPIEPNDYQIGDFIHHEETHIYDYCYYDTNIGGLKTGYNAMLSTFVCQYELPKGRR